MESDKRRGDIAELDNDAQELRVRWRKTHNYFASFAKCFFDARGKFESTDYGLDKYGHPWTFTGWLGFRAGLIDTQVYRMLDQFEKRLASDDREMLAAEKQRAADDKRAEIVRRRQEREAQREARRQAKETRRQEREAARTTAVSTTQPDQPDHPPNPSKALTAHVKYSRAEYMRRWRQKIIAAKGIPALQEIFAKGNLGFCACERIAQLPADIQPQEIDKAIAKQTRRARPDNGNGSAELHNLTKAARKATQEVLDALQLDSIEARRERVRAYGAALVPLRRKLLSDNEFNAHLKANNLQVRDPQFRSDAMWLAANWDTLPLSDCPYMNPSDIRKWWRFRDIPKPEYSPTAESVKNFH